MATDSDDCTHALDKFSGALDRRDASTSVQAAVTNEDLLHRTLYLRQRYGARKAERILQRLEPFLTSLQSFSEVVKVFLQASPAIVTLLWGSVFFVLEVTSSPRYLFCHKATTK